MSTELAMQDRATLAVAPRYSDEQMQLLTDTIARGCDQNEFRLFIEIAKMSRLSPFTGQIRPVKRWNSDLNREAMVVQTGIDGYRAIASRTGDLAGIEDAVFDSEEGDHPNWAKVTVYRWSHGEKVPFSSTARWKEYVQTKRGGAVNAMWTRMPYLMLAKCAEALALRKAFPDDLAGIYTDEEMGQADNPSDGGARPAVTMPRRNSEKPAETQKNGHAVAAPEKVEGVIEQIRDGQNGAQWLMLKDGRILYLPDKFVDEAIKAGVEIVVAAVKVQRDKENSYLGVVEVLGIGGGGAPIDGGGSAPQAASAERQSEFVQELDSAMSEPSADSAVRLDEMYDNGDVKKASDLPGGNGGGKIIGKSRAQRLYTIITQHKKETGFSDVLLKRIIAQPPLSLEHLTDLPMDWYERIERLCDGKDDWRKYLEGE